MTRTSLDLSGKIDAFLVEILSDISKVAASEGIDFFVIGATARDIVLECGYGIQPPRATRDVDLGVKVADWGQFRKLSEGLTATGKFKTSSSPQRFFYQNGLPLDIVPFGGISGENQSIAWPPRHDIELDLIGFEESFVHALLIRLNTDPLFEIHFVSPVGWTLLKIISWNDRESTERLKDAQDLALILCKYAEVGNENRLYGNEASLLEEEDYDLEKAGARLLGRDIAHIAQQNSLKKILDILEKETGEQERYSLAEDSVQNRVFFEEEFNRNLDLIEKLKQGMLDTL
ncbi:MAG: nucleotidyl transferase AbiEii/AbiGii toxin family protein [Desulfobulbaceae bacterium]|nr:nucleotidyl transferase AbiEii/AbiGii toxin family protein [Desulfobulbaceae bacterium]